MKRGIVFAAIAGVVLVLGAGWYFGSPPLALSQLRQAAIEGDEQQLEERIDFPSVRESLKTEMRAAMAQEMVRQQNSGEDGFAVLGNAFAMAMVDSVVDGFVNPQSMAKMIEQGKMEQASAAEPDSEGEPSSGNADPEWEISRSGLSRFTATPITEEGDKVPTLIFERDGLSWRLSAIDLPDQALAKE